MRFLIITPAKNEGEYIGGLIESMAAQEKLPERWVIVDDGSTDDTVAIIQSHQKKLPWLFLEQKENKGEVRSGGSKVVRAFYHGFDRHQDIDHDVVMKLDADLTLPLDYLSRMQNEFEKDGSLGICGGYCMVPTEDGWHREAQSSHHVRGALKAYRKECFDAIGGITETWNWDGLDNMMAMQKKWTVRNIESAVKHHRPTTAAYEPVQHAYRSGVEAYRMGSDLPLALLRSAFKLHTSPILKNSVHYLKGFLDARRRKEPKVVDEQLARFIRRFTYQRILTLDRN